MAPPARGSSSGAAAAAAAAADAADGGGFAAATAALRQCIAGHYREGPAAGQRAVAAAVQQHLGPLLQRGDTLLAGEAVELAFRQVLSEDLVARALAAKEDILVRRVQARKGRTRPGLLPSHSLTLSRTHSCASYALSHR